LFSNPFLPHSPCTCPHLSSPDKSSQKNLSLSLCHSKFRVPLSVATTFLVSERKTMDIKEYTLGEGRLLYVPHWADDPDALYREAKKLSFTPENRTMYGKTNIIERQTVDYGLPYSYNKTAKPPSSGGCRD